MNDVNFKITFDCKHEGGHYYKLKFDWFKPGATQTEDSTLQVESETIDTGFLKDWTLVRIEGEEAVETVQEDTKDKGKGGKAPPAKGGAKGGAA